MRLLSLFQRRSLIEDNDDDEDDRDEDKEDDDRDEDDEGRRGDDHEDGDEDGDEEDDHEDHEENDFDDEDDDRPRPPLAVVDILVTRMSTTALDTRTSSLGPQVRDATTSTAALAQWPGYSVADDGVGVQWCPVIATVRPRSWRALGVRDVDTGAGFGTVPNPPYVTRCSVNPRVDPRVPATRTVSVRVCAVSVRVRLSRPAGNP